MLTLQLARPRSVAHLAHFGDNGWASRCTMLWEGSEWIDSGAALVTRAAWNGRGASRPLELHALAELPVSVRLCTRCVRRVREDAEQVECALRVRGLR